MTSSPHGANGQGLKRNRMDGTEGRQTGRGVQSQNDDCSTDCSLQLEYMKSESLVIADVHGAVKTFAGIVHAARHTVGVGFTRSR